MFYLIYWLGIGIGNLKLGLGIGIGDWGLRLGIGIGKWEWGVGLRLKLGCYNIYHLVLAKTNLTKSSLRKTKGL